MDIVRWGLLSTAHINRRLIPAIWAAPRGELTAVASRDQATADAYAKKWNIHHAFSSYQAMLDSDLIDAVYIGLPNHLHAEWSIKAMKAGKHVLCEKPFALTLDEVNGMIETSQKTGRVLVEAFMYLFHPQAKIARDWIRDGHIGEPLIIRSVFNYQMEGKVNVRLIPEYGGGSLWDVGVYPLSFAQFIFGGPPTAVNGFSVIGETGVDEIFIGQMIYPGGGLAQISSSFRSPYMIHAEIIGNAGRLVLTRPFASMEDGRKMTFYPVDNPPFEIPVPDVELYSGEVEAMHAAILDGVPPFLTLEETRNHIRTVLGLYESVKQCRTVEL
ncbi:MAG: Oxidoreductase domain protein [Chloroflexi bacterium]|nr:Oxidoreductase domain protein [Chloroflexota bacterium]